MYNSALWKSSSTEGMLFKSGLVFVGNFQLKRTEFKKGNILYNFINVFNLKQVVRI